MSLQEFMDTPVASFPKPGAVLIDVSNLLFRSIFGSEEYQKRRQVEMDMIRHLTWNMLLRHRRLHDRKTYPVMILAFDRPEYWRKAAFKQYKMNRVKAEDEGEVLSEQVMACFRTIRDELIRSSPYVAVSVPGAEADDVIAVVAKDRSENGSCAVVVSGDRDMVQLCALGGVRVWTPNKGQDGGFLDLSKTEAASLLEDKILRGDPGDGIPNVLSSDDFFYPERKGRQKPVTAKAKALILSGSHPDESVKRNLARNSLLIDFRFIPDSISAEVLAAVERDAERAELVRRELYSYFMSHGLKQHLMNLQHF